jgi:hypothetical protein
VKQHANCGKESSEIRARGAYNTFLKHKLFLPLPSVVDTLMTFEDAHGGTVDEVNRLIPPKFYPCQCQTILST